MGTTANAVTGTISKPWNYVCTIQLQDKTHLKQTTAVVVEVIVNLSERICLSRGSIGRIGSRFGVGVRSFSWNWSVRNGGVLGESSTYFREASRRLSTRREWDWHAPDAC
jgi:hypothetical protein